ncbi:hypothetical protein [Lactiplantibacillus daowaiensis]|uniref:ABC transporter permease n=1 Tax=Lactiplantibacillus daowaiensis TaxID=2559918 RepID=A0ABW1S0I5_9LACO|nr:hypothetical protein [Lactiplantibacillus daowaiensis]
MTTKRVSQLWWHATRWWFGILFGVIILIGLVTAIMATTKWQHMTQISQHVPAYYLQFFHAGLDTAKYQQMQMDISPDHWFYLAAGLSGLGLAFWGRQTHYDEFLLNLGATRQQLWVVQGQQLVALIGAVLLSQLGHYVWILIAVPSRFLQYMPVAWLGWSSLALALTSGVLIAISWLIGQLTANWWLAGLVSGLVWWRGYLMIGNTSMTTTTQSMQSALNWLALRPFITIGVALVTLGGSLYLSRYLMLRWSAEQFDGPDHYRLGALIGLLTLSGGPLLSQQLLPNVPFHDLIGGVTVLVISYSGLQVAKLRPSKKENAK